MRPSLKRAALIEALETRRLLTVTPQLLSNINSTTDMLLPSNVTTVGSIGYFLGHNSAADGGELFRTDGTRAGTFQVTDLVPGIVGSNPTSITAVGSTISFNGFDAAGDRELYKSNGTAAGTVRVKDIRSGTGGSNPSNLTAVGGVLYFSADDGTSGVELWKSDGTAAGTVRVADIVSGSTSSSPSSLCDANGSLIFAAGPSFTDVSLYRLVNDVPTLLAAHADPQNVSVMGSTVFFNAGSSAFGTYNRGDLYRVDGSTVTRIASIDYLTNGVERATTSSGVVSGSYFYFLAGNALSGGFDLWRSDGTGPGTINLLNDGSFASNVLTPIGGRSIFFAHSSTASGAEPWTSDGTAAGTKILKEIASGSTSGVGLTAMSAIAVGSTLYFLPASDAGDGSLWRTDGTSAGTTLVKDIDEISNGPVAVGTVNGLALIGRGRFATTGDLFRSNGTANGTFRLGATTTGDGSSITYKAPSPTGLQFATADEKMMYFAASDGDHGSELWRTDAEGLGAFRVTDLAPGGESANPTDFHVAPDHSVYFAATTLAAGIELYRLAPDHVTVQQLTNLVPLTSDVTLTNLTVIGNTLYFAANDLRGDFLYCYDPAVGSVTSVTTPAGETFRFPTRLVRAGDFWYFGAAAIKAGGSSTNGQELYRFSDATAGSAATPQIVRDIASGTGDSSPSPIGAIGSNLLFDASNSFGRELWITDGTSANTRMLKDLSRDTLSTTFHKFDYAKPVEVNGVLYFSAATSGSDADRLWRTDGTDGGTYTLAGVTSPQQMLSFEGRVYFTGLDSTGGRNVYRTDGNDADGPLRLTDPESGDATFRAVGLFAAGGNVFIVNRAGAQSADRWELWRTLNDAGSAQLLLNLQPDVNIDYLETGTLSRYFADGLQALAANADALYLPAFASSTGLEPYRLAFSTLGTRVVSRQIFYNESVFDGYRTAADAGDLNAIATDKEALLPGQSASFKNYISTQSGVTGILIDLNSSAVGTLSVADFVIKTGNFSPAAGWADGPTPTVTMLATPVGSNVARVALTWPAGSIRNQWVQVSVAANARTGLFAPDVFYVGSAVGETGNSATSATVDSADYYGVRDHLRDFSNPAPITWNWDFNRDGVTDITDVMIIRASSNSAAGSALSLIFAASINEAPKKAASTPLPLVQRTFITLSPRTPSPATRSWAVRARPLH